jgi:hypothetical protein
MGNLSCDGTIVEFDDRLLAHLQVVIVQKFRAGEAFLMSWLDPLSVGDGRSSIWLTPECPVHFKFVGSRAPTIDREWLDLLTRSAGSGTGLIVMNEQGELVHAVAHTIGRPH